jgi:phage terminase Nu1 subunit (DNA packaging protein)
MTSTYNNLVGFNFMTNKQCTTAELAGLLGITVQRVTQLTAEHVFKRVGRNRYNTAECVQAYVRYREGLARAELGDGNSLTSARTEWVETRARLAQLELQTRSGELVSRADVTQAWSAIVSTLRMRLLSVPAHISAQCGALDTQTRGRVHDVATSQIHNALEELSTIEVEAA